MITPTQQSLIDAFQLQYGKADKVLTNNECIWIKQGVIVRLDWCEQNRHLFILPNGDRLTWEGFQF